MKHIISILLLLATIGCRQKGPAEVTGMVSPGEYSEYQLFLIDGDKQDFFRSNWMVTHLGS